MEKLSCDCQQKKLTSFFAWANVQSNVNDLER